MSATSAPPKATAKGSRAGWLGCGFVIVVMLMLAGVVATVQHLTSGPVTVTMPDFRGQSCESATPS